MQATRQQELITELEEELDNLQRQLEVKDSELELWKSGIRRLSKIWTPESTPGTFPPVTYIPSLFRIYSPCALFVEVFFFGAKFILVLFHEIEFSQTHIYCTQSKDHHLPVYHHTRSFKVFTILSFKKAILKIISIKLDAGNEVLSLTNPIFEKTCPDDDMDMEIKTPEASNFHVPFQEFGSSEEGSKQSRQLFVTPATLWRENWIWNQQEDVHSAEEV